MKNRQEFAQKIKQEISTKILPISLNMLDRFGMPESEFVFVIKALERTGEITVENESIVSYVEKNKEKSNFVKSDYNAAYLKEHYESIHVAVPKGKKASIKVKAESLGMSVNAYILSLINKDLEEN